MCVCGCEALKCSSGCQSQAIFPRNDGFFSTFDQCRQWLSFLNWGLKILNWVFCVVKFDYFLDIFVVI